MIATKSEKILRIRWDGVEERDFSLDLKRIPFSINQQVSYGTMALFDRPQKSRKWISFYTFFILLLLLFLLPAVPILEQNTYVTSMEYSPLIGGFAITLNDGRAAYLTASSLKFDPNVCIPSASYSECISHVSRHPNNLSVYFHSKCKAFGRRDWTMPRAPASIINSG